MLRLDAPLAPALQAFVNPENDETTHKTSLNTIVMQVHRGVSMEKLIELIGASLTHKDDKVRTRATLVLAEVLSRLPQLPLSPKAMETLMEFFCDRLKDYPSASACLQALMALESHHGQQNEYPAETTVQMVRKIVTGLHIPQLSQSLRKRCFEIMQLAVDQRRVRVLLTSEANEMEFGTKFVVGFMNAMEGEKDPRNLLLCLKVCEQLMEHLHLVFEQNAQVLQQFFDVTSCYFPITFTPPPNDPYGIATEDLVQSLRNVLASSDLMAKLVVPFLVEKMNSNATEAKVDSLQTLVFCCEKYSLNALLLQLKQLSELLYHQVVKGDKKEVIVEALEAISRIAAKIGRSRTAVGAFPDGSQPSGANFAWTKFVELATDKVMHDLQDNSPDSLVSSSASKVLAALGRDSSKVFGYVVHRAMPFLLNEVRENEQAPSKCESCLSRILSLVNLIEREVNLSAESQPMRPYASEIMETMQQVLKNALDNPLVSLEHKEDQAMESDSIVVSRAVRASSHAKRLAMEGLCHLITFPPSPLLTSSQVEELVELFTRLLLESPSAEVRTEALNSLKSVSEKAASYAIVIKQKSLASLLQVLKWSPQQREVQEIMKKSNRSSYRELAHDTLLNITEFREQSIFQSSVEQLVDLCLAQPSSSTKSPMLLVLDSAEMNALVGETMQALARMFESNTETKGTMDFCLSTPVKKHNQALVFLLLDAVANSAAAFASIHTTESELIPPMRTILTSCARICRVVMQTSSAQSQQKLADFAVSMFLRGPFDQELNAFSPALLQLVPIFSAMINSTAPSVVLADSRLLINRLLQLAQFSSLEYLVLSQQAALCSAKSLASIVNKMADGDDFDALIKLLLDSNLSRILMDESEQLSTRQAALQIYLWIAKALIIRAHPEHAPNCLKFLCGFLTPDEGSPPSKLRMDVANGFSLLLTDDADVLNRNCGARITFLYRQRLFDLVFPALVAFIDHHPTIEERVEVLVALAHVVSNSPKAIYAVHTNKILPLIVQAINVDNKDLGSAAIRAFKVLLFESIEGVKPHLKDVFPGLLKQAQHGRGAMDRRMALECIGKMTVVPYDLLHPFKDLVLRSLLVCLNDHKRFVRHVAVRVRNQWSIL